MRVSLKICILLSMSSVTLSFVMPAARTGWVTCSSSFSFTDLSMTKRRGGGKKKGFGTEVATNKEPSKDATEENISTTPNSSASPDATIISAVASAGVNAGQKALTRLRAERQAKEDEELRKVKELRTMEEIVRDDPNAAVIPEKVAMRMGKRMLPFVGIPLFGGMGAFVAFWYLATYKNQEFQPAIVAATTIGLLAIGLVGITYSVISASWDPDLEGSALGVDEFKNNVQNLKDGLARSRENAILREKTEGLSDEEIKQALRDLERREENKKKKEAATFEEKMKQEGF